MNKEELIQYIKLNDPFFRDAQFEKYSYYELMVIKISIEVEKAQVASVEKSRREGLPLL
jgi:hypothetical protein